MEFQPQQKERPGALDGLESEGLQNQQGERDLRHATPLFSGEHE